MTENKVRVVVSGSAWMGSGIGSIESALHDLFKKATNEVTIVAYAISGAATILFRKIEELLQRGIRLQLLIKRYSRQPSPVQQELAALQKNFSSLLQLFSFVPSNEGSDLHAKI